MESNNLGSGSVVVTAGCNSAVGLKLASESPVRRLVGLVITVFAVAILGILASGIRVSSLAAPADLAPTWGQVLIAGGGGAVSFSGLSSTELYDPASNTFATASNTATMNYGRYSGTATLLASGKVLIVGGLNRTYWATTDLYDPATNSFAAAGSTATMNTGRYGHTATLLASGQVLIAGGYSNLVGDLSSTELYDPASNSFAAATTTATMNTARSDVTATLLPSGKVLIAGGYDDISGNVYSSTELYDPASNTFATAGNTATMNTGRFGARATLLPSGKVLIAGGYADNVNFPVLASTELYDPATNSFAAATDTATMNAGRADAIPTLLPSGKVLIEGGYDSSNNALSSTELYDPVTNSFAAAGNTPTMNSARGGATAVLLRPQTAPVITITAPTAATYTLNQAVVATYTCTDPADPVKVCAGSVANGANVDTSSVGNKTFSVNAIDSFNNSSNQSVEYSVAYNICPQYDQTKAVHSGATVPIKLQLCDANGADVSGSNVIIHATGVAMVSTNAPEALEDAGNANPDDDFRFDSSLGTTGGYIFNLQTGGYPTGTFALQFTAGNDPTSHTAQFGVK